MQIFPTQLPDIAGNHPNYYLLGFSAALAPKFPPGARLKPHPEDGLWL